LKEDAHYYAILAFCRAVGFKKDAAHTVAYASQFVDDAKINHIKLDQNPNEIQYEIISDEPSFFNMATCHQYFRVNTFNYNAMMNNTTAFHFVPGCKGENFSKKLRCSEESPIILDILEDVKGNGDLVKLGIVLHSYADTFSHQGFSGLLSKVNAIRDCKRASMIYIGWKERLYSIINFFKKNKFDRYFDRLSPAYGHGQALTFPDIPYLEWEYKYDYSDNFSKKFKVTKIDNKKRFRKAFKNIKSYLLEYINIHSEYQDNNVNFSNYDILFKSLLYKASLKKRIRNWKKTFIDQGLFSIKDTDIINYDNNLWLEKAFKNFSKEKFDNRKVTNVSLSNNFKNCNWYKYYLGVNWYKNRFYKYCLKHGLQIPK